MSNRVKCRQCDHMILDVTAKINDGLCANCRSSQNKTMFETTVAGWLKNPATLPGSNGNPVPRDIALAIRANQIRQQLANPNSAAAVIGQFFDAAYDVWIERGPNALTEKEKAVLSIETFFGEITNGGIVQFLSNESHAFAGWAAKSLRTVGLTEYVHVMTQIEALFPDNQIPSDWDACWAVLAELDDDTLHEIEQPFWNRYRSNESEFQTKLHGYLVS